MISLGRRTKIQCVFSPRGAEGGCWLWAQHTGEPLCPPHEQLPHRQPVEAVPAWHSQDRPTACVCPSTQDLRVLQAALQLSLRPCLPIYFLSVRWIWSCWQEWKLPLAGNKDRCSFSSTGLLFPQSLVRTQAAHMLAVPKRATSNTTPAPAQRALCGCSLNQSNQDTDGLTSFYLVLPSMPACLPLSHTLRKAMFTFHPYRSLS